jgi:hypothetical protein
MTAQVLAPAAGLGIPHGAALAIAKVQIGILRKLGETTAVRQDEVLASERNDRFRLRAISKPRSTRGEPLH